MRVVVLLVLLFSAWSAPASELPARPNVVFILADDLGYGDLGCYGQKQIQTPHLDRLAASGTRFTQAYAGSTVCGPSRCCLLTGQHTGHTFIRGNGKQSLRATDTTVATLLRRTGYRTACIGKYGLGLADDSGSPDKQGFDHQFGYLTHIHAHNYYPDFLWRNGTKEPIPANPQKLPGVAAERGQYAPDLFLADALKFLDGPSDKPFFLYYAAIAPHANNERGKADGHGMEVPTDEPYSQRDWPTAQKCHAAMITRLDRDIGTLLAKLRERGLDKNTLVMFSSDNGPHKEGGANPAFFQSSGPLRGIKRDLTEGGIRVPFIAALPGHVPVAVSERPIAFWDVLPTLCELASVPVPSGLDGVSLAPTLAGKTQPATDRYLYWEFHEGGSQQAARHGDWKAIRKFGQPLELYDLRTDLGETRNVAAEQPTVVAEFETYLRTARTESAAWPLKEITKNGKKVGVIP